ncbi:ABC transporter substrate-binding protein [Thalassospira sp. TSL5-1]|uniref:substrate-binding periplasmic protein n=1 Tax=Thalassospira sp. TSL5-1 TaxID=1544451 RepID=UPI000938EC19|nr:transporter substrate-binding domain-containing protein [Thalassospira sp. TSL5-1]OKH89621.1 hypothetical protein LF95_06695 [Thalassospira sp. TSL5-1]
MSYSGLGLGTRVVSLVIALAFLLCAPVFASAQQAAGHVSEEGYIGAARSVRIYTENLPPFNYLTEDGFTGIGAEVVSAMARLVGHNGKFEMMPWKRVLSILDRDPYTAAFSMVRIPEREHEFKWVGPITHSETAFYQLADSPLHIQSMEDARNVPAIGVNAGSASERALRALGFKNVMPLYAPNTGLKMLLSGRISLWETVDLVVTSQSRQLGVSPSEVKAALPLGKYDFYLAFSAKTPETVVLPWRQALNELRRNGVFDQIQRRYGVKSSSLYGPRKTSFSLLN